MTVEDPQKLPADVIDHWPEVLGDVTIYTLPPVEYLHGIYVSFDDGRVWEIAIDESQVDDEAIEAVEQAIDQILHEYEESIEHIDFHLNTQKLKTDIQKRTQAFMKKRK